MTLKITGNHAIVMGESLAELFAGTLLCPSCVLKSVTIVYKQRRLSNIAERIAIQVYRKLVNYFGNADSTSRRLFEDILSDEEDHANDLSDLISVVDSRKKSV
jgi:hypothetical protein